MDIKDLAKITAKAASLEARCKELELSQKEMSQRLSKANLELKKTSERLARALKKTTGKAINADDELLLFKARATLEFTKHLGGNRALKIRGPYLRSSYSAISTDKKSLFTMAIKDLRERGWK